MQRRGVGVEQKPRKQQRISSTLHLSRGKNPVYNISEDESLTGVAYREIQE